MITNDASAARAEVMAVLDRRAVAVRAKDIDRLMSLYCGTLRSGGPTSSRRTITVRPTTSPGWSGRSPSPYARCKSAAMTERIKTVTEGWYGPALIRHETAPTTAQPR